MHFRRTFGLRRAVFACLVGLCFIMTPSRAFAGGPPQIPEFIAVYESLDVWTIVGIVVDEEPGECVVFFGDLCEGYWVVPDSDGYFELTVQLEPNQTGIVTAIAVDPELKESEVAIDYIQ